MRATRNQLQDFSLRAVNAVSALARPAPEGAAAASLAVLALLDDELTEETAIRARTADGAIDEPVEVVAFGLGPPVSPPEPLRMPDIPPRILRDAEEGVGDSMLARYFRDMALHPVMGPEEELDTARTVERTEVEYWVALLSLPAAAVHILAWLRGALASAGEEQVKAPQVPELLRLAQTARKRGKGASELHRQYGELCRNLAHAIRLPDTDRVLDEQSLVSRARPCARA